MKIFLLIITLIFITGCATGVSTYEYTHMADGSTHVEVKSANEIEAMKMGINRETGQLEVEIGGMTKADNTAAIVGSIQGIVHDLSPIPGG